MEELQSWWEVPTIAHFCSLFRAAFSLLDFDIEELEEALLTEGSDEGNPFLTDLIIRLLSGCYQRTDLNTQNYQKYLNDFIKHHWSKEQDKENLLENKEFSNLSLRHKVGILHALCDARLDSPDVADVLKNLEADSLRVEPLGRDESNATYWYFYGTRLYKEAQISEIEIKNKEKEKLRKKKEKEKEKKRKRRERKKRRGKGKKGKDRKDKNRRSSSSESDSDDEESLLQSAKRPYTGWQVVCSTEIEWKELAERFKKSKNRNEKELYRTLTVDFLPEIGRMIIEREKQQKKKSIEFAPRRSSQRIERLRQQREEEERLVAISLVEEQKRFLNDCPKETDKERREREARQREERLIERQIAREERARRVHLREERARLIAEGKELPLHLQNSSYPAKNKRIYNEFTESVEDLYVGMYKVFEILKSHRDSWPFIQPVNEEYAPGYYGIVKNPMDLSTIEKNLQRKTYLSKADFESDVLLMLENCRKYNGIDSDYTRMSKNLQFTFEKAMQRFFPQDSSDDDLSGSEELELVKPTVSNQLVKPLTVKGIEVLARAAEQALQSSSQKATNEKSYTLTISNVHPASLSDSSIARSIGNSTLNKNKTNLSLCMVNIPSDKNSLLETDKSNLSKTGIKQRFQQILYSSGKEMSKDNLGNKLDTTEQDKKTKISCSLDAMSKMVDGLPEKQKRSILNFTAIYQASLIARNEKKNESASGIGSEVNDDNKMEDLVENEGGNKITDKNCESSAETLVCFEQKKEQSMESNIKTEDKINSNIDVQCNASQTGTKNIVILNSSAFSNANIPVNSNILVLHNGIPMSAITSTTSANNLSNNNTTTVSNSPLVYCQLATTTTTTASSIIPNLTFVTSDSGNNSISAAASIADKSLNLPNNAIPVKKRAYLSVETSTATTAVSTSNGLKKDGENKRKLQIDEKGETSRMIKLPKSETAYKNGSGVLIKNGLQRQQLLNLNSVVANATTSNDKAVLSEVVNCGQTSVITSHSSVTNSSSPLIKVVNSTPEVVEGLAGKLQQQGSSSLPQDVEANKTTTDSGLVKTTIPISTNNNIVKGYVHLPRGVSPAAENFAQKLTMDVSGNIGNNCVRLGTQVRNKTTVLMSTGIPKQNTNSNQQALRLQPKISPPQNNINHVVNNVMIANYTSPHTTTIAVQPQQAPVQYSICIGQNRLNTSSSGGTTYHTSSAVPITSQSHCEKLATTPIQNTHIQLNSGLNDSSKQTILSPQLQYVDQSGIRYTALPANLVPLTVRTEQAQPQQLFYVQQQGQMVLQPQLLTQHYQSTSHTVASQPGFGSPKTIITMPAVPQQTFLATQPQSLSTSVHNGTSTHYYTVLPHHPMT